MIADELHKSLLLFEPHICCDEAEMYLYPPRRGTDDYVPCKRGGMIRYRAVANWRIDEGNGGHIVPVRFCPFCGVELPIIEAVVR